MARPTAARTGAAPAAGSRCVTCAPGRTRRGPTARPSASSRPACVNGPMRAPLRARTNAPARWFLGSSTPIKPGRMPPWPTRRPSPGFANRRSLVRPRAPFLRPDPPSPTTGPPGRRQERRRRPASAGAKRPCADPPDRSRSNRREPNARSPEQRSWKRQLAGPAVPGRHGRAGQQSCSQDRRRAIRSANRVLRPEIRQPYRSPGAHSRSANPCPFLNVSGSEISAA
jgi:hypothetical protein